MHGKRLRRIGDDCPYGVTRESFRQDVCFLLDRIHGFYEAALDRLLAGKIPSLDPRLLKAGVCLGFLDPVSNIIANTISYTPSPEEEEEEEEEKDGEDCPRNSILSKIITNTNDRQVFVVPLSPDRVECMTVARRSLEGLISFLIFHYRYLENTEALRYLRLAGGDLLAAVRLIEQDRCQSPDEFAFNVISLTTKIALECAAVSTRHPRPTVLVGVSLSLASQPVKVSKILRAHCSLCPATIKPLAKLLRASIDLAGPRVNKKKRKRDDPTPVNTESAEWKPGTHAAFRHTQTLKLLLLGKIHALYLEALARLPRDGLRMLHHCSLIKGGYCYGPMDPVSNIILNTIWYGAAFLTHQDLTFDFQVDMICTRTLMRIECCSLYGLIAFLRARFSSLTEHDALWYLLATNVDLWLAMKMVQESHHAICGTDSDAYKKAALDSWHPDPDALVKFAMSSLDIEPTKLSHMLAHALDSCAVEHLTTLMSKFLSTKSKEKVQLLNKVSPSSKILNENQKMLILAIRRKFKADCYLSCTPSQSLYAYIYSFERLNNTTIIFRNLSLHLPFNTDKEFYVKKVNAALNRFSQQKGVDYELHIICGVNPKVTEGSCVNLFKKKFKFEYFHINFWATPKGSLGTPLVLFFAECSNIDNDEEERPSLCFPVLGSWIDDARCFCCERNGVKIVHPRLERYNGCSEDFRMMASGKHGVLNEFIISSYELAVDDMCTLKEDWIYFDPNMDAKIAQMNPVPDWARKIREWGRII